MKLSSPFLIFFLLFFYSAQSLSSVIIETQIDQVSIAFHLSQNSQISQISEDKMITELPVTIDPGKPQVPFYTVFLKGKPDEFIINLNKGIPSPIKTSNPPLAPEKPCRCGDFKNRLLEDTYDSKQSYRLDYLGDFRGENLTRLLVYPQTTDPEGKNYQLYPELAINIQKKDGTRPMVYKQAVMAFLDKMKAATKTPSILVITQNNWIKSFTPWVQWKNQQGIKVRFEALEQIGSSPADIKEYLHQQYASTDSTFQYAILVGHENLLPTFYLRTSSSEETPSDLPYFTMGGDGDHIPDVFYGRLVVDNEDELHLQLKKTMEYEKATAIETPGLGYSHGVGIASNEGKNPSDEDYLLGVEKPFVDNENFKFKNFLQKNATSIPENINEQIEAGISWMTYIGHGSGHSWASLYSQDYSSGDVAALKPNRIRPVIIDVSCQNGRFLYEGRLGERFMNEKSGENPLGAVAYYGGSVDISWDPPALMAQGISRSYYDQHLEHLGETLLSGQMSLYEKITDTNAIVENLIWYHLLGDPTLLIRTGVQKTLTATLSRDKLSLYIKDKNGRALPATVVTFSEQDGLFSTGISDSSGKVKIPKPTKTSAYSILKKGYFYLEGSL